MPKLFSDPADIADDIIRDVGRKLVVGLPLGLGKANHIVNALYARAARRPLHRSHLLLGADAGEAAPAQSAGARFITPVIDRLFGGYPDLAYAAAAAQGRLPPNIHVDRVLLSRRAMAACAARAAELHLRELHPRGVLSAGAPASMSSTQLVAKRVVGGVPRYSLSCNTDITLDVLKARAEGTGVVQAGGARSIPNCRSCRAPAISPRMSSARCSTAPRPTFPLFAPPSEPINDAKYAIGLHAASLVRDGGTLQIGIGQVGDALAQGLIVRHRDDAQFHVDHAAPFAGPRAGARAARSRRASMASARW